MTLLYRSTEQFGKFGTYPYCGVLRNQCRIYKEENEDPFNKLVTVVYLLNVCLSYHIVTSLDRVFGHLFVGFVTQFFFIFPKPTCGIMQD